MAKTGELKGEEWVGKVIGRWTILAALPKEKGHIRVNCRCACGREKPVKLRTIVVGTSKGCRYCAIPKLVAACHPERKHFAHGLCQACYKRKRFSENTEAHESAKKSDRLSYKRNASILNEESRERNIMYGYFLTPEQWTVIYHYQQGKCFLCNKTLKSRFTDENPEGKTAATDHCHATGEVRGLVCAMPCNFLLGEDYDVAFVRRLLLYLESPPVRQALGKKHFALPGRLGTKIWQKRRKSFKDVPRLTELGLAKSLEEYKRTHGREWHATKEKEKG